MTYKHLIVTLSLSIVSASFSHAEPGLDNIFDGSAKSGKAAERTPVTTGSKSENINFNQFLAAPKPAAPMAPAVTPTPDEGMWTYDNLPLDLIKERYGEQNVPPQEWFDQLRLSSARVDSGGGGGSSSFISPTGLVLTNWHVAFSCVQLLSNEKNDYTKDGYYAQNQQEEGKCTNLKLRVLLSMKDVTERVVKAGEAGKTEEESEKLRQDEIKKITTELQLPKNQQANVVSLYHGGQYLLYIYKIYDDVRLVFTPETKIAYFGGDYDNFVYPRAALDMAILRVYEDGKPVKAENYMEWDTEGVKEGDLVFVSGSPGRTARLKTMAQLQFERDFEQPTALYKLRAFQKMADDYAAKGQKEALRTASFRFGINNSLKSREGMLGGLQDSNLWNARTAQEKELRDSVSKDPELQKLYGDTWDKLADVKKKEAERFIQKSYFMNRISFLSSNLNRVAISALENGKLEENAFKNVDPEYETRFLATELSLISEKLDKNDPYITSILEGRKPEDAAKEIISQSKLLDPKYREELARGGKDAIEKSDDPLLVLARKNMARAQEIGKWNAANIAGPEADAQAKVSRARFAVYGKKAYPDATFTLRVTFGTVKGYEQGTTLMPHKTTLGQYFSRSDSFDNKEPFDLPKRWQDARNKLDLSVPLNFVADLDIHGGNSGSNTTRYVPGQRPKLTGLIFDGNIQSLPTTYHYDGKQGRSISVDARGMMYSLRNVYKMTDLADEIEGKK